jgi:6-phosphogluconolactonase (cycloisomerase 2 family)
VVPNGSITSYSASKSGKLSTIERQTTISGPVSGVIYDRHGKKAGLAAAHYTGSSVTVWSINANGKFSHVQDLTYTLAKPGPNPARQEAPHPHEALLDPTGKYILVPDLGADLVRVFCYDEKTYK